MGLKNQPSQQQLAKYLSSHPVLSLQQASPVRKLLPQVLLDLLHVHLRHLL
ncbi:MAG: hypothetical protein V3U14_08490 [candidate division NC10 bacterium]